MKKLDKWGLTIHLFGCAYVEMQLLSAVAASHLALMHDGGPGVGSRSIWQYLMRMAVHHHVCSRDQTP